MANEEKTTCNYPGCKTKIKCRGLCAKHYQHLNSTVPAIKAEAEKHASERTTKRGRRLIKPKTTHRTTHLTDAAASLTPPDPKPIERKQPPDDGSRSTKSDELIGEARATADDAFIVMGAKPIRLPVGQGMLYVMAETNRLAYVDPMGVIKNATIHAGENNELIMGTPE